MSSFCAPLEQQAIISYLSLPKSKRRSAHALEVAALEAIQLSAFARVSDLLFASHIPDQSRLLAAILRSLTLERLSKENPVFDGSGSTPKFMMVITGSISIALGEKSELQQSELMRVQRHFRKHSSNIVFTAAAATENMSAQSNCLLTFTQGEAILPSTCENCVLRDLPSESTDESTKVLLAVASEEDWQEVLNELEELDDSFSSQECEKKHKRECLRLLFQDELDAGDHREPRSVESEVNRFDSLLNYAVYKVVLQHGIVYNQAALNDGFEYILLRGQLSVSRDFQSQDQLQSSNQVISTVGSVFGLQSITSISSSSASFREETISCLSEYAILLVIDGRRRIRLTSSSNSQVVVAAGGNQLPQQSQATMLKQQIHRKKRGGSQTMLLSSSPATGFISGGFAPPSENASANDAATTPEMNQRESFTGESNMNTSNNEQTITTTSSSSLQQSQANLAQKQQNTNRISISKLQLSQMQNNSSIIQQFQRTNKQLAGIVSGHTKLKISHNSSSSLSSATVNLTKNNSDDSLDGSNNYLPNLVTAVSASGTTGKSSMLNSPSSRFFRYSINQSSNARSGAAVAPTTVIPPPQQQEIGCSSENASSSNLSSSTSKNTSKSNNYSPFSSQDISGVVGSMQSPQKMKSSIFRTRKYSSERSIQMADQQNSRIPDHRRDVKKVSSIEQLNFDGGGSNRDDDSMSMLTGGRQNQSSSNQLTSSEKKNNPLLLQQQGSVDTLEQDSEENQGTHQKNSMIKSKNPYSQQHKKFQQEQTSLAEINGVASAATASAFETKSASNFSDEINEHSNKSIPDSSQNNLNKPNSSNTTINSNGLVLSRRFGKHPLTNTAIPAPPIVARISSEKSISINSQHSLIPKNAQLSSPARSFIPLRKSFNKFNSEEPFNQSTIQLANHLSQTPISSFNTLETSSNQQQESNQVDTINNNNNNTRSQQQLPQFNTMIRSPQRKLSLNKNQKSMQLNNNSETDQERTAEAEGNNENALEQNYNSNNNNNFELKNQLPNNRIISNLKKQIGSISSIPFMSLSPQPKKSLLVNRRTIINKSMSQASVQSSQYQQQQSSNRIISVNHNTDSPFALKNNSVNITQTDSKSQLPFRTMNQTQTSGNFFSNNKGQLVQAQSTTNNNQIGANSSSSSSRWSTRDMRLLHEYSLQQQQTCEESDNTIFTKNKQDNNYGDITTTAITLENPEDQDDDEQQSFRMCPQFSNSTMLIMDQSQPILVQQEQPETGTTNKPSKMKPFVPLLDLQNLNENGSQVNNFFGNNTATTQQSTITQKLPQQSFSLQQNVPMLIQQIQSKATSKQQQQQQHHQSFPTTVSSVPILGVSLSQYQQQQQLNSPIKSTAKKVPMNRPSTALAIGRAASDAANTIADGKRFAADTANASDEYAKDNSKKGNISIQMPQSVRPSTPAVKKLNLTNLSEKVQKTSDQIGNAKEQFEEGFCEIKQSRLILPSFNLPGSASQPHLVHAHLSNLNSSSDEATPTSAALRHRFNDSNKSTAGSSAFNNNNNNNNSSSLLMNAFGGAKSAKKIPSLATTASQYHSGFGQLPSPPNPIPIHTLCPGLFPTSDKIKAMQSLRTKQQQSHQMQSSLGSSNNITANPL